MMNTEEIKKIRADFPALKQKPYGQELVYFDTAATALTPQCVIDEISDYYSNNSSSVHRGAHYLSDLATDKLEQARANIKDFTGANKSSEIIFTKGTTEGLNLVAETYGRLVLRKGDEVLITAQEHHANLIPWQRICGQVGAQLKIWPITEQGILSDDLSKLISKNTKILALTHISNALGIINPVKEIIAQAKNLNPNLVCVLDAAQSVPHMAIDMADLDCDFAVFSGHKLFGPTGIGVLYGKAKWLEIMPPYQTGGAMVDEVAFEKTTFAKSPAKFEAGTPNIAGILGLSAAVSYIRNLRFQYGQELIDYENTLRKRLESGLRNMKSVKVLGDLGPDSKAKASITSFIMSNAHPHDISSIVDRDGIAIRAGHLCTQPLVRLYGESAFARVSLSFYNTEQEVDKFLVSLKKVNKIFNRD